MARFSDIKPGSDGEVVVTISFDGDVASQFRGKYASAVRLEQVDQCGTVDSDGDGVNDGCDNCTVIANPVQRDTNGDGYGNFCDADLDNNGIVNTFDLAGFKAAFGTADADADFDGNGVVNTFDLVRFKAMFGLPPGPSAVDN